MIYLKAMNTILQTSSYVDISKTRLPLAASRASIR